MAVKSLRVGSFVIVATILAALSIFQITTETVPTWSIQFVDQLDKPFVDLRVQQSWQHYSIESDAHFAVETTDENGIAVFPARHVQASLLKRILGPLQSFLFRGGVHAGYGAHSFVLPVCNLRVQGPNLLILADSQLPAKAILVLGNSGVVRSECTAVEAQAKNADRLVRTSN